MELHALSQFNYGKVKPFRISEINRLRTQHRRCLVILKQDIVHLSGGHNRLPEMPCLDFLLSRFPILAG